MSHEPRTAQVNLLVTKSLEIDEPDWCVGHHDDHAQFKVDISHDGPEHVIAPSGYPLFRASLTQAPYSNVDRSLGLYVEAADYTGTHSPDEIEQLADDLVAAAERLRELGRELADILARGEG
ncbi:DUF6907 domain-containing protein [Streptomyces sp. NPDC096205]|uniref:DUF6907 domain-containing protein n=1 Tax=Streptomyces sp. NPDC096205 TaxID=3366081 RepID=UPI0037F7168E